MTSLAKQLQRLAVPHTQAVLGDDRKKASLLFDPKEAASIDRETFHEIGLNGLEQLETIDEEFQTFETSLFGDSSLTFERSIQTKEVNEKLDETIKRFLIRLSQYCLMKPAHKTLEWLIHRFHIHFYNTDDLLLCFLPYHENKIFARVLQLIRFDSKIASKWDWLEPLQKSGVHLSRTTLVNHCGTDTAFLSFVCDMAPQAVTVLTETDFTSKCRVLFNFYATTLIGVLDSVPVTEVILSIILPHLCRGMKSAITEYKAASYMILAQLLYKTNLKPALVKTIQHILAKSIKIELMQEAMACMLLLFQTQDVTNIGISKKAFKHICSHYTIIETIAELCVQFDTKTFLLYFLLRLIPAAFQHTVGLATSGESSASESNSSVPEYRSLLHRLLSSVKLHEDVAEEAAYKFLSVYIQHGNTYLDKDVDERVKENLQGIVRQLEGKHSAAVDRAVNRTLSECQSKQDRDLVQEFLNLYVLSVPHQVLGDTETSLVLSLNHRLASVREKAVMTLIQNRDMVEDESLIQNSLSLRLKDEDPQVTLAALTIGQDLWSIINDDRVTMQLLQTPLLKGIESPLWHKPGTASARILGAYDGDISLEVFPGCLPCLFVRQESQYNMEIADILLSSAMMSKHSILLKIAEEWRTSRKLLATRTLSDGLVSREIARCIAVGLQADVNENGLDNVTVWTKLASEGQICRVSSLMLIVLDDLITMTTDVRVRLLICRLQTELINSLQKKEKIDNRSKRYTWDNVSDNWDVVIASTKVCLKEKVPSLFCLKALYSIVSSLKVPSHLELVDTSTWQLDGDGGEGDVFLRLMVQLYGMFLEHTEWGPHNVNYYSNLLGVLQTACFGNFRSFIKFHCLVSMQHVNDKSSDLGLTLTFQTRSLKYGLDIIEATKDEESKKILLNSVDMMSSILVTLASEQLPVRQAGICYTKALVSLAEQRCCVYLQLLQKIVSCQTEILADHAYLKQVIVSIFNATPLNKKSPIKLPRKSKGSRKSGTKLDIMSDNECALLEIMNLIVDEHTPDYQQYALLEIFSVLNNQDILTALLPLMDRLVSQSGKSMTVTSSRSITLLVQRFTLDTTACLSPKSRGLKLFIQVLKLTGNNVQGSASPQLMAISQISKQLFMALESDSQHALLSTLFDVCVDTKNINVTDQIRKVIRHLSVDGDHILEELKRCLIEPIASTVRQAKKLKRMEPEVPVVVSSEFDTQVWHRVVIVLESVQTKKKIANFTAIVPVCFSILSSILNSDNHTSAEYIKQLILTLLQNICGKMENSAENGDTVPESQFNMDLIVNCIRSSDNPQTHHQALLLLTAAAKIYPEHLLHNMMSVFTFMGANIMRKDDAYSFLIIGKILETVIPALIMACEQRKCVPMGITNDLEDIITMVIQVFVDSYPYIPEHRRHLLFNKLLTVINEEKYLWRTLLLLMKHVATKGTLRAELASEQQESLGNFPTNDTEFCLSLCADFTCAIQLSATRDMIEYLLKLPDDKEDAPVKACKQPQMSFGNLCKEDAAIFNVVVHTSKQLRYFKYATVNLLVSLFSSHDFSRQVAGENKELLPHFQCVLEMVLRCVSHVTQTANRSSSKPTARFWRSLQHKAHEMLDKLVSLLPNTMFIDVIGRLLSNDLPTIQRKAMDLLNIKLHQQQKELEHSEVTALLPIVKQLREYVCAISESSHISEDNTINCQTAFVCLKLLCRNIGLQHREEFIQVLKTSVEIVKLETTGIQVRSCALLCIAEICQTIKVYMIQYLPSFMPALINILTDQEQLLMNELYLMSVVTTVNKVVENLSHFMSPYLHDILTLVCVLSSKSSKLDILQKPQVQQRLRMIRTTLSTGTPTRVLLPVVSSCYATLVSSSLVSVSSLMSLLSDHIAQISQEDLSSHLAQLQSFFLKCLDIRIDYPKISNKKLSQLEGVTIDTIITMVLKLSETTFKPFLFKIFDWATTNEQYKERVLVFYSLAARLAERLRSLFTIFAGHIMKNAASLLDQNNKMKGGKKFFPQDKSKHRKSCRLLEHILDTIYRCCLYDTEGFINKDRFDMLMQPLVDQIENDQGGEELFEQRISQHLVPCIVQMCVAVHDESLWQLLNYQVCLKTRNQDTKVKKAALITLDALNKKLGEDYLSFLPDTIPFLAELMEDESEEVEKKCHEMIRDMEKTLGEPLQKYF